MSNTARIEHPVTLVGAPQLTWRSHPLVLFAQQQAYLKTCLWLIAFTSALDAGFALYYREVIINTEQNPLCLALILLEPDGMSLFLIAKSMGTVFALVAVVGVYRFRQHLGATVATGLSLFQVGLIGYQLCW